MIDNYNAYLAEAFGTACLVLLGCASVTLAGNGAALPLGGMPISLAFGLTVTFLIYGIGPVSGCHINPAITLGLWAANRFTGAKVVGYVASQLIGGLVGAGILLVILKGRTGGYDPAALGLGQTGWAQYSVAIAFVSEFVATFIFMAVIIGSVANADSKLLAGVSIGLCLFVLISCFINVSGGSLNPARSIGPAIFVGGTAISQLWLFIVAPTLGAVSAGLIFRKREVSS
ncbi:aquaporin [Mesorhizobium sophorae]|uniref:aquaporin n=1 Tax=Mesorhizobium sophorae TaxID=1300294 RepID=UPI000BA3141D|nr:aquaporin [Mesorhizobium sophorae]